MLDSSTLIFEDQFTEKEYETTRLHQKTTDDFEISWHRMNKAWRDDNGILCVEYANGNWWHYNELGEWW